MAEDNNKKPFKVTISDEDYMKPDELDELNSRLSESGHSRPKPKFEVNILDDDDGSDELANLSENEYKGEIYFSGVKAVKNNNQVNSSSAKNKKKRKKGIGAFAFFLIVVIVLTSSITAFSLSCLNDILAFSRSEDTVTINIPLDADTNDIIDILADNGLVKQRTFCKLFYQLLSTVLNKKTPVYLSGVYYVEKNMGLEGYLYEFRESQAGKDTVIVSIPEGWSIYQICERLEKFGVCSSKKIISSLKGTSFEYDFIDKIYADPARTFKLEGYLYPNTYEFYADSDPNSVIRKFLDEFEAKWSDKYQKQADKLGLSMDEIIIIASIIQREAADKDQMKDISSVIHNRLSHMASWPTLNCDSTDTYISKYILPNVPASESLIYTQKYSTYNNQGLPPGPICNPGDDAINAALYPNDTNYYFFRHDKYGKIYLASTQAQHDANANAVLRANSK